MYLMRSRHCDKRNIMRFCNLRRFQHSRWATQTNIPRRWEALFRPGLSPFEIVSSWPVPGQSRDESGFEVEQSQCVIARVANVKLVRVSKANALKQKIESKFWVLVVLYIFYSHLMNNSTVRIWNPTNWNLETFEIWTFWGPDFKWSGLSYCDSPEHLKTRPFEIWTKQSRF